MAASTRSGSLNQALARRIGNELEGAGESVDLLELADVDHPRTDHVHAELAKFARQAARVDEAASS